MLSITFDEHCLVARLGFISLYFFFSFKINSSRLPKLLFAAPIILNRFMDLGNSVTNCEASAKTFLN